MTQDRGDIAMNFNTKLQSAEEPDGAVLQYDCQWNIRPPDDETGIQLQFNSFFIPSAGTGLLKLVSSSLNQFACTDSFIEIRVGKNQVSKNISNLLFILMSTLGYAPNLLGIIYAAQLAGCLLVWHAYWRINLFYFVSAN
jgi:hypothetical protein